MEVQLVILATRNFYNMNNKHLIYPEKISFIQDYPNVILYFTFFKIDY